MNPSVTNLDLLIGILELELEVLVLLAVLLVVNHFELCILGSRTSIILLGMLVAKAGVGVGHVHSEIWLSLRRRKRLLI